jgi:hypothetical protein
MLFVPLEQKKKGGVSTLLISSPEAYTSLYQAFGVGVSLLSEHPAFQLRQALLRQQCILLSG